MFGFLKRLFSGHITIEKLLKEEEKIVEKLELEVLEKLEATQDDRECIMDVVQTIKDIPLNKRIDLINGNVIEEFKGQENFNILIGIWENNISQQLKLKDGK